MPAPFPQPVRKPFRHLGQALCLGISAIASILLWGCGTTQVTHTQPILPARRPDIVLIADFELDAARIESQPGLIPPPTLPGPLAGRLPPPPGSPRPSNTLACDLVAAMANRLVEEVTRGGLSARRHAPDGPIPTSGWLVRGAFTKVNQGHQARRAVIGFGAGKTELQVLVALRDLSQGPPPPASEWRIDADSGNAPGAGPTMVLGPAGVAARFVMASKDLDHDVQRVAKAIAAEILRRANSPSDSMSPSPQWTDTTQP